MPRNVQDDWKISDSSGVLTVVVNILDAGLVVTRIKEGA